MSPFRNQHLLDGAFVSGTNLMELCHSLLYCKSGIWAESSLGGMSWDNGLFSVVHGHIS